MNREEQQLIEDLFSRLRSYGSGADGKDPDAEGLINDLIRRSPDSPYYLAQTVIIQQQALERAEQRMRDLEEAAARRPATSSEGRGSFLSRSSVPSTGGRYSNAEQDMPPQQREPAPQAQSPWASRAPAGGGGGGFLSSALTTAAGVAGGVFLADGIRSLFGGGSAQAAGERSASDQAEMNRLQDDAQDARDDADKSKSDLAADDSELDRMQDANDSDDDYDDTFDDDSMDI